MVKVSYASVTSQSIQILQMRRRMMSRLEIACSLVLTGMAMSACLMALYVMVFML
jgi:hypothetical protein